MSGDDLADEVYHCPLCGFEWDSAELGGGPPPYPHCPECEDGMLRAGAARESDYIGNCMPTVPLEPGTGLLVKVDGTYYETKCVYPLTKGVSADPEDAKSIRLEPYPSGGIKGRNDPEVELAFVSGDHSYAVATVPSTLGVPDMVDHDAMQQTMLESAAKLAENGEHEQADELAALTVGYYTEATRRD